MKYIQLAKLFQVYMKLCLELEIFFPLYFDSVKMMEFILLYEANIPLKKPTCI